MSPQNRSQPSKNPARHSDTKETPQAPQRPQEPRTVSFWYSGQVPSKSNYRKGGANWRKQWGRIKDVQEQLGWLARASGVSDRGQPVEVYILARKQRPDLDNLAKLVCDSLEGVAYVRDDQRYLVGVHVVRCHREGEAGIEVSVRYTSHDVVREGA